MRESKFYSRLFKLERYGFVKESEGCYRIYNNSRNRVRLTFKLDYEEGWGDFKVQIVDTNLPEKYLNHYQGRLYSTIYEFGRIRDITKYRLSCLYNALSIYNNQIVETEFKLKFVPTKEELKDKCEEVQEYFDKYKKIIEEETHKNIIPMLETDQDWGMPKKYIEIKNAYQEVLKFKNIYNPKVFPESCLSLDPIRAVEFYASREFAFNSEYLKRLTKNDYLKQREIKEFESEKI